MEHSHQPDSSPASSSPLETIKYVDRVYRKDERRYAHTDTDAAIAGSPAERAQPLSDLTKDYDTSWKNYHFVVERDISIESSVSFTLMIQNPELLEACKSVMGTVPGVSWTATPVPVRILSMCKYNSCAHAVSLP